MPCVEALLALRSENFESNGKINFPDPNAVREFQLSCADSKDCAHVIAPSHVLVETGA
jgi:hypothetical protein